MGGKDEGGEERRCEKMRGDVEVWEDERKRRGGKERGEVW